MAPTVEIPKATDAELSQRTPGAPRWSPVIEHGTGRRLKPIIRCNCGRWSGIGLHHVHADGRVMASFYHKRGTVYPEDPHGCEWHVFLKLKDYDWGEFKPGEGKVG